MVVTQENVAVNGSRRRSPQEIAAALRDRIRTGDLRPGDRLPTQAELSEEFGVERGAVREALRILHAERLLTNVSKGSPPRVAEVTPPREGPQPTLVGLAPRLTDAFSAPHVRVDAACLTAESLMLAVGEPVRLIHEGRIRPKSIDVRILLPSRDITLAFPVPVEGRGDDDLVHQRWLAQRNAQGHVLRHNLLALRSSHGIDVHVTFRALPFTPPVKLYLLNGTEALMAYYMIARREEQAESGAPLDMYDALGRESLLFSFEKGAGERDTAFVEQSQKWFDALWETITTDLTLS
ncbi:GntR family transcriptional regulator [Streptomyces sp. ME02-8801-2C]|uniref:FadR/GntR family transcriptional regulator n=1 Tax=Streptomyces sp. ME02-8801-2C TaxID=3028680 RepID=UPI0029B37684|nr:GntR family transcriptional regulator [Streptomyces sp. ME02-8801-2C]MDX3455373.1 GntR family transcriptional regulator [Streptomyces sp. ME02-8801-2C]